MHKFCTSYFACSSSAGCTGSHSQIKLLNWRNSSPQVWNNAWLSTKDVFCMTQLSSLTSRSVSCVLVEWMCSTIKKEYNQEGDIFAEYLFQEAAETSSIAFCLVPKAKRGVHCEAFLCVSVEHIAIEEGRLFVRLDENMMACVMRMMSSSTKCKELCHQRVWCSEFSPLTRLRPEP